LLLEQKQTPVVRLNRSVILAQSGHLQKAISEILAIQGIEALIHSQYMYGAVLGDLYLQSGDRDKAKEMLGKAYTLTSSQAEKKLIAGKLSAANSNN
ncbi:MAG TPA: hypothetical protein VK543_18005, partial [Puia sp.]|nr:hypothetical protein [Puia sp.]